MVSSIIKTKRDGTILIEDGTAITPLAITVSYEQGDLSVEIPGRTVNNFLDRGEFGEIPSLRWGDDQPITWSFTANLRDLTDDAAGTLMDIITDSGYVGSDWVSTLGANAEVKTFKLTFTIEGTDHGDAADHTLEMNHCVVTGSISEGDPDTISLSGTSFIVYPTLT